MVRGRFELPVSFHSDTVVSHQATNATVTHIEAYVFQLLRHAWTAITAQRHGKLLADVGKHDHVLSLALAEGTTSERTISTRADIHDLAQSFDRQGKQSPGLFTDPCKSRSIPFSLRSSAISRSRSGWKVGFSRLRRSCFIQRFNVEKPTPQSAATCFRGSPLVKATRTASARNSSVGRNAIFALRCDTIRCQRSGTIQQ